MQGRPGHLRQHARVEACPHGHIANCSTINGIVSHIETLTIPLPPHSPLVARLPSHHAASSLWPTLRIALPFRLAKGKRAWIGYQQTSSGQPSGATAPWCHKCSCWRTCPPTAHRTLPRQGRQVRSGSSKKFPTTVALYSSQSGAIPLYPARLA